ncbi:MAG: hypothetical protein A2314_01730 [Elusimicrobia bacterium RIFOXYB2_FULL_50_12]|nr:MAG: hypothetical protein A2314_01730 [Elusimicrobia bacterium RIFOXYB2_FULL_50_12]
MTLKLKSGIALIVCLFMLPVGAAAFGKNKVITRGFNWQIQPIEHFDVYYYDAPGSAMLPYVNGYLRGAYGRVTDVLPVVPKNNFPFFLYNNHNDFEQTNIVSIGEGTGGVTEAFKNRFLVGHLGSQRYLEYVIAHEFTHEVEFEYLFNGFWRSLRVLKLVIYPNWLLEGLAEYTSGDLDSTTREMYLRDAATLNKLLPLEQLYSFNHVLPHQVTLAYKESEALMRYIADEYGRDKLALLLQAYQERFDADTVLTGTLGIDLAGLDKKFREYMEDDYTLKSANLSESSAYGRLLTPAGEYPRFFQCAVFSPGGETMAYISDERGNNEIYLMDLETKKTRRLVDLAESISVENVHTEGSGLSFSSDGRFLVFAGERQQEDNLYLYDMAACRLEKIDVPTDTAASPVLSGDGAVMYYSGMRDGFRDIYAYTISTRMVRQLTGTPMDEVDAVLSPGGGELVFAAERRNAQGRIEYDLCLLPVAGTGAGTFITDLPGDERSPCFSPDGKKIYFTSDADGITDIYVYELDGGSLRRLTKVVGGNFQPRVSPDGKNLLYSSFRDSRRLLYLMDIENATPLLPPAGNGALAGDVPAPPYDLPVSSGDIRPYRFRASVDLFFPMLLYSSLDGLYTAAYWQLSEFLGNHQLQAVATYASAAEYLDYQLTYGFLKFRPQVYFTAAGNEYFEDYTTQIKQKMNRQQAAVLFPLNRLQRIEIILTTIERRLQYRDTPGANAHTRENVAGLAFVHDTVQGPYLEPVSGARLRLAGEFSDKILCGDFRYQDAIVETHRFVPLGRQHVLALRAFAAGSFGENAGLFRLGGSDRVRGLPADAFQFGGRRLFVNNIEWRFPLVHNINYHIWYFFPDFFFKTMYGSVFVDGGLAWNDEDELLADTAGAAKGSYGAGIRVHTFILESYPLMLNFELARRMDQHNYVLYFTLGSTF